MNLFPLASPFQQEKVTAPGADTFVDLVNSHSPDWYLPLAETEGTTAAAEAGPAGTYVNSPQLGVTSIAQNDPAGNSVGLSGDTTNTPHITVTSPLTGASITLMALIQLDTITKAKHQILTHSGGLTVGQISVEVLQNGQLRCFSDDAANTPFPFLSATGAVPQGAAVALFYQRQSNVAGWSQRAWVNGQLVAEDTVQRTWPAFAAGTLYIGTWFTGTEFLDPMDGLIAHVAGWNRLLSQAEMVDLSRAKGVAWAVDIDAGAMLINSSKVVSVQQGGWHGRLPLTVTAGDGAEVTTTESGGDVTLQSGADAIADDTISYSFVDVDGNSSQERIIQIDVETAPAGVSIGALTAFQPSRVRVTTLSGWPAGRTPSEVITQGTHAHGYVRRSWKPSDNDGTWMDFQAGWRKTSAADVIRIGLDDGSELDLSYTVNHTIPTPGSGGILRYVDATAASNGSGAVNDPYRDWSFAVAALNTNDVLVVRARAGGQVYSFGANTGGATSTANGVKIVADPDDLAAGRRPRIHIWGSRYARFADDLNNGHWVVDTALGGVHGNVWRSAATFASPGDVGCSYRTKRGTLRRCYTYTNTPTTPGALARLRDKTYPRVAATGASGSNAPGTWDLYHGPGIYWHAADQRLYIRLSPLKKHGTQFVGALQVNEAAGVGPNPPWDWTDDDPENENPNLCELYITQTGDQAEYNPRPTQNLNYIIRINGTNGWTIENLDFVGGGNGIEMFNTNNTTIRGCRGLGWAPPNLSKDVVGQSTAARVYNFLDAQNAFNVVCDRCEFWGGQAPWFGWDENKGRHGAFSWAHKCNLFYMEDHQGSSPQISIRFLNCLMDGFALFCRQAGDPQYIKFHQCSIRYSGMDGLICTWTPQGTTEFIRSQIFEASLVGWAGQTASRGTMYVGYCLVTNVRPFCHQNGWWNTNTPAPCNYMPARQAIVHGQAKEHRFQYMYNNTGIGSHNHLRNVVVKNGGAGVTRDGAGAYFFPYRGVPFLKEWFGRNNIMAVRPNGCQGDTGGQTGGPTGDSHCSLIMHATHIGWDASPPGVTYSCDYNMYHRGGGMPNVDSTGVVTTVNAAGTENPRNSITDVRTDTGQENNGRFANPLFVGVWDAGKLDREIHTNAFWCLQLGSPAASGGDGTNRSWLDVDFGTVVDYLGNSWIGCMDPQASAVEQQVGPLGPLPSDG